MEVAKSFPIFRPDQRPRSTVLTVEEEAVVVAFRRHTLLPLDDCLYALQPTIAHLTRSSLHRCLQRHGVSRLPQVEGEASPKRKFKAYPIGYFHIDIAEVRTAEGKLSIRRACAVLEFDRSTYHYKSRRHEQASQKPASKRSARRAFGMATGASMFFCAVRAGRSI